MDITISPNRDKKGAPARIEKAPTREQGLSKKLYSEYSAIPANYHGLSNQIPTGKQIIASYWESLNFFKKLEQQHQKTAQWYFNYSREMEAKACRELDKAELAYQNYVHYLELIGMATLKSGGLQDV